MIGDGQVFAIQGLPEEQVAVLLAKYSRNPGSMRDILDGMIRAGEAGSSSWHEKYTIGYGHSCYDDITEVLTINGWVRWCDLSISNPPHLATLNPTSLEIEYLQPLSVISHYYSGDMYFVDSNSVDLVVTPNHKMWTCNTRTKTGREKRDFNLVQASDIIGVPCVYQIGASVWRGRQTDISLDLMRLMGFFIGDGWWDSRCKSAIRFHLRRPRKIAYLRKLCLNANLHLAEHSSDHYYITQDGIGTLMSRCYNAEKEKIIPLDILSCDRAALEALFEGLIESDGSRGKNAIVYDTTSVELRDQMYELALKLGYAAYSAILHPGNEVHKDVWRVYINRTRLRPEVNKVSYRKQDGWIPYKGMVYCATMPKNHILYVRRNMKPVWSGNSVAEHAQLHLGLEGISILAAKAIEDCRLASYTEKSTRYVDFSDAPFYDRVDFPHAYRQTCQSLFVSYVNWFPIVRNTIASERPGASDGAIHARTCDVMRYILPASTLTNVGLSGNARTIAGMVRKMKGSGISEVVDLSSQLREAASGVCPTLIRYTDDVSLDVSSRAADQLGLSDTSQYYSTPVLEGSGVRMLRYDPNGQHELAAALLYPHAGSFDQARSATVSPFVQQSVLDECLGARNPHQPFPRAAEHVVYRIEITCDYGAYRDLQRHRMATQTDQPLTPDLGYEVPPGLQATGLQDAYHSMMKGIRPAWQAMVDAVGPMEAQYVIPLAFRKRFLMTLNLREAAHLIELRSARQGHWSYRAIARQLHAEIARVHPVVARHIRVQQGD